MHVFAPRLGNAFRRVATGDWLVTWRDGMLTKPALTHDLCFENVFGVVWNPVLVEDAKVLFFEGLFTVMFSLIPDVLLDCVGHRLADRECTESDLPLKFTTNPLLFVDPLGRIGLQQLNRL